MQRKISEATWRTGKDWALKVLLDVSAGYKTIFRTWKIFPESFFGEYYFNECLSWCEKEILRNEYGSDVILIIRAFSNRKCSRSWTERDSAAPMEAWTLRAGTQDPAGRYFPITKRLRKGSTSSSKRSHEQEEWNSIATSPFSGVPGLASGAWSRFQAWTLHGRI